MAKALYRKYRPKVLDEVVGQNQITEALGASLAQGKISHAYLFIGPRGTGKTSVARIFAHAVNDFSYEIEDDYVDIVEIDGASNRGIDNIRELKEKAAIAPTYGKYKVYIIDEVHMLTKEAFNALLKTLEEPPKHVIFIMATTDAYKVPVTITSRAQTYTFRLADAKTMLEHLRKVADEEKISISDGALELIVRRGGGSFRDSLSLLDQISTLSETKITKEIVERAMGLPEDDQIENLLSIYPTGDMAEIVRELKKLLDTGIKPETVAEEMMAKIIIAPSSETLELLAKLPDVKAPFAEAKLLVALTGKVRPAEVESKKVASGEMVRPIKTILKTEIKEQTIEKKETPQATIATQVVCNFDWGNFVEKVQKLNNAISAQLLKCSYRFRGGALELYPDKKITRTILARDNNRRILIEASGGIKVIVHEAGEKPEDEKKDEFLAKISAIMGGEVENDGGGSPF